jgi:uncharacterized protein YbaR (Trm112 family)
MPIQDSFLEMLRCPKTFSGLRRAQPEEAILINEKWIVKNSGADNLTGFLVSTDGAWGYVERNGIPCLLLDEAVAIK